MNEYRGKHASSQPWAVSSSASVRRGKHEMRSKKKRRWRIFLSCLILLVLVFPFLQAQFLTTQYLQLTSDQLPADLNHLRIVFLSDIHYGYWFSDSRLNGLVNRINSLKPDIVIFGGDYATDNASAVQFFQRLPNIHARYDILGVPGEADRGVSSFDLSQLEDAMRSAGVKPLVNAVVPVRCGASIIYVAGSDDALTGAPDIAGMARKVKSSDYVIFVSHNPSLIPSAHEATDASGSLGWFDLGLFGHTHGGQMLFFSSMLDIADDVPERYRSGYRKENRSDLLISNGVGTSILPARLLIPAQIHCIELVVN